METIQVRPTARLATIEQLRQTVIQNYLDPVPQAECLRLWFKDAKIPCFKANPLAVRGGGPVYYSVAAVEKFFRSRIMGTAV